ncbi:MAG: ROK family protein [Spirochaetota bacterium]|nr:ROK family protein [Spirochaetota bacterium]
MYIGLDIGGTNIKGVLTNRSGNILKFRKIPTKKKSDEIINSIIELIENLAISHSTSISNIKAIGIGSAGSIDKKSGIVIISPNIPAWRGYPLTAVIEKRTGIKVYLENDATAATVGEWWKGNGNKFRNWIMLTLGTGIGGGIVINNELYTGRSGNAMELCHTTINYKGPKCSCGNRGCLEMYASASAVVRFTKIELRKDKHISSSIHYRINKEKLSSKLVYEEAIKGDLLAQRVFHQVSTFLGIGIANIVNIFNPEAVILGGGLSRAHKLILPVVKDVVNDRALPGLKENIKYTISKNGYRLPALGAAKIAIDNLENRSISNRFS